MCSVLINASVTAHTINFGLQIMIAHIAAQHPEHNIVLNKSVSRLQLKSEKIMNSSELFPKRKHFSSFRAVW